MRMVKWHEMKRKSQIFLRNIILILGINTKNNFLNTTKISDDPIENVIYKYFKTVTKKNTGKLITNLDNKKLFNLRIFQPS